MHLPNDVLGAFKRGMAQILLSVTLSDGVNIGDRLDRAFAMNL